MKSNQNKEHPEDGVEVVEERNVQVPPPTRTTVTDEAFIKSLINDDSVEMNNDVVVDDVERDGEKERMMILNTDVTPGETAKTKDQETEPERTAPTAPRRQQQQQRRAVRQHGAQAVYPSGRRGGGGRNDNDNIQDEDESLYSSDLATTTGTATTSTTTTPSAIVGSSNTDITADADLEEQPVQIEITEAENIPQAMVDELNETQQKNQILQEQLRKLQEQTSNVVVASHVVTKDDIDDDDDDEEGGKGTTKRGKSRRLAIMAAMVLLLAAIVVGVAVGVVTSSKKNKSSDNSDTTANSGVTTPSDDDDTLIDNRTTLQRIHDRGYLRCSSFDFEFINDLCRATAAAIFGIENYEQHLEIAYVPFLDIWASFANKTLDLSFGGITWFMHRDVYGPWEGEHYSVRYSTPYKYTGIRFAGLKDYVDCADHGDTLTGVCRSLNVCVYLDSAHEAFVDRHLGGSNYVTQDPTDTLDQPFVNGDCNVVTTAGAESTLAHLRGLNYTGEFYISDKVHEKEPLAAMSPGDDAEFADFVSWVVHALNAAWGRNITQETAAQFLPTTNLFGEQYSNMFIDAVSLIGNMEELYNRTLPEKHASVNTINNGTSGLLYAMPFGDTLIKTDGPVPNGKLELIAGRDVLRCGIIHNSTRPAGFVSIDQQASNITSDAGINGTIWTGFDIDVCRGIAAALFTTADGHIEWVEVPTVSVGFEKLANGEIDVLPGAPYTMQNDVKEPATGRGYDFSPVYYYGSSDNEPSLAIATLEDDEQWSDFVTWIIFALIYAEEEEITDASDMPIVLLFGPVYKQSFRDLIIEVGTYGQIYERNVEAYNPRAVGRGRMNQVNYGSTPLFVDPEMYGFWS